MRHFGFTVYEGIGECEFWHDCSGLERHGTSENCWRERIFCNNILGCSIVRSATANSVITVIIFNLFSKSQWRKCDLKVNLPLAAGQKKTDFHERGVAIIASTALNWAHTANFHIFWHQCVDITIWSAMRNWSNLSFCTGTILHTVMHLLCARTWFSPFLYNHYNHSCLCIENKYSTKLTSVRNCWCHAYSLIHIKRFQASIN